MFIFPINCATYILLRQLCCTEDSINTVFLLQNVIATIFKMQFIRHHLFKDHFTLADLVIYMAILDNFYSKIDDFYYHYLQLQAQVKHSSD